MAITELGACEWFVWDLRRSNLIDRGHLDQLINEFLKKQPNAEPPALAQFLVNHGILSQFQAERLLQGKTQGLVLAIRSTPRLRQHGDGYKAFSRTTKWYAVKVLPRRSMWNVRIARRQFDRLINASIHRWFPLWTSEPREARTILPGRS
jgi:serine/threonine-protein kinase